ncbi:hypothetical protein [Nostoc sp.]
MNKTHSKPTYIDYITLLNCLSDRWRSFVAGCTASWAMLSSSLLNI